MWKNYIEYLDEIVMDGFFHCIFCSLQYLMENTDKEHQDIPPLLECKLELQAPDMVFDPSIEQVSSLCFSLSFLLTTTGKSLEQNQRAVLWLNIKGCLWFKKPYQVQNGFLRAVLRRSTAL